MSKSEVNNLKEAEKVLWWYPQPNSLIDEGNLYFAAIEYQSAYQALQKENEELKQKIERLLND